MLNHKAFPKDIEMVMYFVHVVCYMLYVVRVTETLHLTCGSSKVPDWSNGQSPGLRSAKPHQPNPSDVMPNTEGNVSS